MEPFPMMMQADCWMTPMHRVSSRCVDYIDVDTPRGAAAPSPFLPQPAINCDPAPLPAPEAATAAAQPVPLVPASLPALTALCHLPGAEVLLRCSASGPRLAALPLLPSAPLPSALEALLGVRPVRTASPLSQPASAAAAAAAAAHSILPSSSCAVAPCTSPSTYLMMQGSQPAGCTPVVTPRWGAFDSFDFGCPYGDDWRGAALMDDDVAAGSHATAASQQQQPLQQHGHGVLSALACLAPGPQACPAAGPQPAGAAAAGSESPSSSNLTETYPSLAQSAAQQAAAAAQQKQQQQPQRSLDDEDDSAGTAHNKRARVAADASASSEEEDDGGDDNSEGGSEYQDEDLEFDPLSDGDGGGRASSKHRSGATKKRVGGGGGGGSSKSTPHHHQGCCYNCRATQTPQWRCGPEGKGTLCNACGMRYRKGVPLAYWDGKKKRKAAGAGRA